MRPDAMELLAGVRAFLLGEVLDQVPAAMRSDIRAAAKSLDNAAGELDRLFPLLVTECDELAAAADRARAALGGVATPRVSSPAETLAEQSGRHAALLDEIGDLALALQQDGRDAEAQAALTAIYRLLREQGRRRMDWQSVFPKGRLVSEVLLDVGTEKLR